MILTDDMLAVAFQYRDTELWQELEDSDVFAIRLPDGEMGYCCVMGHGGEHFALTLYRGEKGFSTYLNTIRFSDSTFSDMGMLDLASTFDCINCDFVQAATMDKEVKKLIRSYAEAHGLKVRRQKGWPDFVRHQPFKGPMDITCEKDANDIVEALRAAIAVAEELKRQSPEELGFELMGDYPTDEGGKVVPYLIPNADGTYDWDTTTLPALLPIEWPAPKFDNDILAGLVKKLPASGLYQVKLFHIPMPVDEADSGDSLPGAMLLCVSGDMLLPLFAMEEVEEELSQMLDELADNLRGNGSKPDVIEVMDDRTESLLTDFCARCDIRLSRTEELQQLDDTYNLLIGTLLQ